LRNGNGNHDLPAGSEVLSLQNRLAWLRSWMELPVRAKML
jgi:hypothetical protein